MTTQTISKPIILTGELITLQDVERAWADSVGAADLYERVQSKRNFDRMLEATDYAEQLQELYNEQYERMWGQQ